MPLQPKLISDAIENGWDHVFMINSPVVAMVARMVIDAYNIPDGNIVCVSMRRADTSLVCKRAYLSKVKWFDRYVVRGLGFSPAGRRILSKVNKNNNNFVVYAAWVYPEVESLLKSKNCAGHVYLEEGQLSYYKANAYPSDKKLSWRFRKKQKLSGNSDYQYRDDAAAWIGILPDVFPLMPEDKRVVLQNFSDVCQKYSARLKGVKKIGLMPTPHRIPFEKLKAALELLIEKMPDGGVIKLHPGFRKMPESRQHLNSLLQNISPGNVEFCDDSVVLELEMLAEPKTLIGARSSLTKYAEGFGSDFEYVEFDGYTAPNN